jgi:hypothetical protein
VKPIFTRWFQKGKRRIDRRLDKTKPPVVGTEPVMTASNIQYEVADRTHAITCGGIGAIHLLADKLGLIDAINERLHLLVIHMPYQESDHVLNFAYNALCGGHCMQDMELRRTDENFLNALGATRTPDPTTAGDFCRRFERSDVETLQNVFNDVRQKVWAEQPDSFFECAIIDADGTTVETTGQCKQGADFAYNGIYGYHPLIVSLANTSEILRIVNRPGNRPSHENAAEELDLALSLCLQSGFREVLLRGDTDFSQTKHLDRWNTNPKVRFVFGYDAVPTLVNLAEKLPQTAWRRLVRPEQYQVQTQPRKRPANVKDQTVRERKYERLRLVSEDVAEFDYRPNACGQSYRMVTLRKNINKEKGEEILGREIRYFFYITNERAWSAEQVVFRANDRCNQENLIAQLKSGVRALKTPVNTLESNWAYMVLTALAWNLKAWWALTLEEKPGRWQDRHRQEKQWVLRLEFRTFLNAFVLLPCQIIRTGRKLIYRLLGWNPHLSTFFRLLNRLRR